jgi:hypothetical protein
MDTVLQRECCLKSSVFHITSPCICLWHCANHALQKLFHHTLISLHMTQSSLNGPLFIFASAAHNSAQHSVGDQENDWINKWLFVSMKLHISHLQSRHIMCMLINVWISALSKLILGFMLIKCQLRVCCARKLEQNRKAILQSLYSE